MKPKMITMGKCEGCGVDYQLDDQGRVTQHGTIGKHCAPKPCVGSSSYQRQAYRWKSKQGAWVLLYVDDEGRTIEGELLKALPPLPRTLSAAAPAAPPHPGA